VCARACRSGIGRTPLSGANEGVLERPDASPQPGCGAGPPVDVLDVMPDGLGRDAEILRRSPGWTRRARARGGLSSSRSVSPAGSSRGRCRQAVAGGGEHRVDSSGSSRPSSAPPRTGRRARRRLWVLRQLLRGSRSSMRSRRSQGSRGASPRIRTREHRTESGSSG
jgi:hypothetical protein